MEPKTAIFTQDEIRDIKGRTYDYNDTPFDTLMSTTKEDNNCLLPYICIDYFGSKSQQGDKFIVPGALLFARKKCKHVFCYIGQVELMRKVRNHIPPNTPAKYQLTINHNATFNNIAYKTVLHRLDLFHGSGCFKKAALYHMGYILDADRKGSNIMAGLNTIKPI